MVIGISAQNNPDYTPQPWHSSLMIFAVMLIVFVVNSIGTKLLSLIEGFVLVIHLTGFLAVLVPMLYFSPVGSARDVFVNFQNNAGWSSNGLSWFIGMSLSANIPLVGYDGPAHLAEEVRNATRNVPWAMVSTVVLNGVLGFAVVIAFSFCILPTFESALTSPTGYDFIEVFYSAMGPTGAAGLTAILIMLMWFATFGFLATASRQTWSFARDGGLPFSNFLAHVNPKLALPLRSIALCTIVPCLIGLINIGSSAAFNAIISLTEAGLYTSYLIPIILVMMKKIRGDPDLQYGPWKMGKVGIAINAFSCVFLVLSIFFGFFPPAVPVTAVTMNWSIAVLGGFVILGFVRTSSRPRRKKMLICDRYGTRSAAGGITMGRSSNSNRRAPLRRDHKRKRCRHNATGSIMQIRVAKCACRVWPVCRYFGITVPEKRSRLVAHASPCTVLYGLVNSTMQVGATPVHSLLPNPQTQAKSESLSVLLLRAR